jgi:hypothetical protein
VGSCIIRAKEEAEQQAAARQAAGPNSPLQASKQLQQAHSPQQQGTPNSAKSAAGSAASNATGVPSPGSSSSRQSLSHMDALTMLAAGADPMHHAATAAMLNQQQQQQQQMHFAGDASSLLHQVSGMSVESLTGVTSNPAAAAAAIPAGSSSCMLGNLGLYHLQPLQQQQQFNSVVGRSTSLPGLGVGANTGLTDAAEAARLAQQLLLATTQHQQILQHQQQQQGMQQQQWALQDLGFLGPAALQYSSFKSPCDDLQQSLAITAACNSQIFGTQHQVNLSVDCRPTMPAASPPTTAAGMATGLYNQHLLLQQQQQQQALLRQQLVQQQLQELAVQEAMLSSAGATAAAAAAAFPSSSTGGALPLGSSCGVLFSAGGPAACFAPNPTTSGSPPHLYTSTGSSGSLSSRWSMPL